MALAMVAFNRDASDPLLLRVGFGSSAEKKLVQTYWPPFLKKLFGTSFFTAPYDEATRTQKLVTSFLKPEVLGDFVGRFGSVCKKSIRENWMGKEKVMAYSLIKKYAFTIACEVFASINDPGRQERLVEEINLALSGVFQLPLYFPGTRHFKAVNATRVIQWELSERGRGGEERGWGEVKKKKKI
ncbi:hypothetical protein AAC387_Pa03g0741 [Persea americana]